PAAAATPPPASPWPERQSLLTFCTMAARSAPRMRPPWSPPVRARMRFPMEIGLAERVFSASRQRWFVLGLCLLAVAFSIQYALKARGSDGHPNRSAIMRWWQPLRHLADENIYERYAYPNPPIMALILQP